MKRILHILIGSCPVPTKLLLILLLPCFLFAECKPGCRCASLLSLGVGSFDTLRPEERMLQFQIEYKWKNNWNGIQPFALAMATEKGSLYFCLGASYDVYLKKYLILTPSFAPGIYFKRGGKDLGYPLEFRSSISLAAQFRGCNRLGVQFYHISNAKLGSSNPGEESLVLFYGFAI